MRARHGNERDMCVGGWWSVKGEEGRDKYRGLEADRRGVVNVCAFFVFLPICCCAMDLLAFLQYSICNMQYTNFIYLLSPI